MARGFGGIAGQCETIQDASFEKEVLRKFACYNDNMARILQEKADLKVLGQAINEIRGQIVKGSEKKYVCGRVWTNTEQVKPSVRGGVCSRQWNEAVHHKNEYYRLTCELHYWDGDETVDRHKEAALRSEEAYKACFDASIPEQIKIEYPITDRTSFRDVYTQIRSGYQEKEKHLEYGNLALSCNEFLIELQQREPDLIRQYDLRCN